MLNDCIQIGLAENVTSLKSLSLKAYKQLNCYNVYSRHKLCAISAAAGILRSYRKAKRKNPGIKEPHARRLRLTTCYGFEIQDGELVLPVRAREYVRIPLNRHVQVAIAGFKVRSMTLTEDRLCLDYANDISEIRPQGFIGIDRNLDNVTIAMSDGSFKRLSYQKQPEQRRSTYRFVHVSSATMFAFAVKSAANMVASNATKFSRSSTTRPN